MLKGFILAIIFGGLIGFGTSNILITANQKKSSISLTTTPSPTGLISTPTPITTFSTPTLTIHTPKNESVVSLANITLKGNTTANSFILLTTSQDSYQTTSDFSGSFSIDLSLSLGANILKAKSISSDNIENSTELLVTYSTAKIE